VGSVRAGYGHGKAWLAAVRALAGRNLGTPELAVIDGNPGLRGALKMQWAGDRDSALH
jgi:hypothetical protein